MINICMNRLSRRDVLKLGKEAVKAVAGFITPTVVSVPGMIAYGVKTGRAPDTAFALGASLRASIGLAGCGSGETRSSERLPLSSLLRPPFIMVEGEPVIATDSQRAIVDQLIAGVTIPETIGDPLLDRTVVELWGTTTKITIPNANRIGSTLIIESPYGGKTVVESDISAYSNTWATETTMDRTSVDTTRVDGNEVLTTNEMNLKRLLKNKGINEDTVPEEVQDYFKYGIRTSIKDKTGQEIQHLPGNIGFVDLIAGVLNELQYPIALKSLQAGIGDSYSWAMELEKARSLFLEKFFTLSPQDLMVPEELRSEEARTIKAELIDMLTAGDNPEELEKSRTVNNSYIEYIFSRLATYKRQIDFIRSPEESMSIIKSIDLIKELLHNPNESDEQLEVVNKKITAVRWLAENDGDGIWNKQISGDVDRRGKKEFWLELPKTKPRAVNVIKLKTEVKTDDAGKVIDTTYFYRNEIVLLDAGGYCHSIYKDEKKNEIPDNPLSNEALNALNQPEAARTEDELKQQGYQLYDEGEPEWKVFGVQELPPEFVRLYHIPDEKASLHWAVPLKGHGEIREALTSKRTAPISLKHIFSFGEKYTHQSLLLDSGKNAGDKFENASFFWADDITDKIWKPCMARGIRQVTQLGLMTPQEFLAKAEIGFYMPENEQLRNLASGWYNQLTAENIDPPIAWGNITSDIGLPVIDVNNGVPVGQYNKGDFFSFYDIKWSDSNIVNGERMPILIVSPDGQLGIPFEPNKLQLISSGIKEINHKALTEFFPSIAVGFLLGMGFGGPVTKVVKFVGNIFAKLIP